VNNRGRVSLPSLRYSQEALRAMSSARVASLTSSTLAVLSLSALSLAALSPTCRQNNINQLPIVDCRQAESFRKCSEGYEEDNKRDITRKRRRGEEVGPGDFGWGEFQRIS